MSVATSTLPAGWSKVLEEMQRHLDRAIASANERIDSLPNADRGTRGAERSTESATWSERLQRLAAYLESAEQVVQSVDEVLQKEETHLRQQLAACGTLTQKLAEGMGRAIG